MTKILVLYYSMYGHIEIMAKAVAEGVHSANADQILVSFKGNCIRGTCFSRSGDRFLEKLRANDNFRSKLRAQ